MILLDMALTLVHQREFGNSWQAGWCIKANLFDLTNNISIVMDH